MSAYDVVIIGAGLSGLAAGIRLSQYGKHVRIFEQQHGVGGLNTYYQRHGRYYDVGLHAMTNMAAKNDRSAPLNKLFRQLRIRRDDVELCLPKICRIAFPGVSLCFDNDIETLRSSVRSAFPCDIDAFDALIERVRNDDSFNPSLGYLSTRRMLAELNLPPLLQEMILCPLMYYGSSWPQDIDFHQFCILFRSIFLEGMMRPATGMEAFISLLVRRFQENGGVLTLGRKISRLCVKDGLATGVVDEAGEEHTAALVLSCAGYPETMALTGGQGEQAPVGEVSFVETMFELDCEPRILGFTDSIQFRNNTKEFRFASPDGASMDLTSQVICLPGNFVGCRETDSLNMVRMTCLANYGIWRDMTSEAYKAEKERVKHEQQVWLEACYPGFSAHLVQSDMFTPLTFERFTGRKRGAIYGSPCKLKSGMTAIPNLFICGTDQGFLGIVGSLLSGVIIANQHLQK